jgi:hypothetical protein
MWMGGTHFALQISNDGGITWVFANAYTCQIAEDKLNDTEIKI